MRYVTIVLLLLSTVGCNLANARKATEQPNIIFVFADDWGYGDLGCYGNTEVATPHIDKLAAEGTLYTQFHVTSGVCSPSRTSVITDSPPGIGCMGILQATSPMPGEGCRTGWMKHCPFICRV